MRRSRDVLPWFSAGATTVADAAPFCGAPISPELSRLLVTLIVAMCGSLQERRKAGQGAVQPTPRPTPTISLLLLVQSAQARDRRPVRYRAEVGVIQRERPLVLIRQLVRREEVGPAVLAREVREFQLGERLRVVDERGPGRREERRPDLDA